MGKKSKSPVEAVDDEFMKQLGDKGDDEIPLSVKAKDPSKSTQSDQPIPEAAEKTEMKSDQLKNAPSGREQTDWEKLVNSRSKILNQIQTETTDWPAKQQALESKLKIDEAAIKQQIKNLEADWSKNKVKIAQEVEKDQNEIMLKMKAEAGAWLQQERQLKQEVTDSKEKIHKQIEEKTTIWLKNKDELNKEVKQHEVDQQSHKNAIISFKQEETQLKLQLAGRIVNNMYILIKDDTNLSSEMQRFVNDVAKIKESNQNKVIFTDDDQLQQFKNKMPKFAVDNSSKSTLTFTLSNALKELTEYDVNQYGSNMQEVKNSLKAFAQYAGKEKIFKSIPQFAEIDKIEQNRRKITNTNNQVQLLDQKIDKIKEILTTQEQAHQKQITRLHQSIAQAEEKIVKAKQDYQNKKATLAKKITQIQEMVEKAEQDYQNKKATLEAEIQTVQSQGKENIQQEERAYQESIKKLEKEYEQVNTEIRMVCQNIQNEQEQQALEAKRIASEKKGHDPEISEQPSKGVKDVAKRVGRSLKNFAKNTKTKAQELGATIKTTIGEAKDNVSEKLEPITNKLSSLQDTIFKENGNPRNWKATIENQKNKLVRKIRGRGWE